MTNGIIFKYAYKFINIKRTIDQVIALASVSFNAVNQLRGL